MDFKLIDGELTAEKLDKMETVQLVIRLFSNYVKDLAIWIKVLWALITRYFLLFLCVMTYLLMLQFKPTRMILISMYIFFAIFWSFFPYAFKCVMIYQITSISYCIHALGYAVLGLISWIIALAMYNNTELEQAKAKARNINMK
jgi:membrane associated rhomboid family serine protease